MFKVEEIQSILSERKNYGGLSGREAVIGLKRFGPNSRPKRLRTGFFKRLWHIFSEPMMLLILIAAAVYFFIGDILETVIFALAVIPIGLMEFFQERRTDKAVAYLDKILLENCKVYRDGELAEMDIKFLVPGDLVYLSAGDKIPADGLIISSPGFLVDESLLTGEAAPVTKFEAPDEFSAILEEHKLSQGTLITQGQGKMLVVATGEKTAYGQLGSLLTKIISQRTPLQIKINKLVKLVAVGAILTAVAIGFLLYLRQGLSEGLLAALSISMAIIPEELPVVFSVFLVMGVWRLAKENALVREMAMVETIGSATVICTDKTGTLTEGKMSLKKIFYQGKIFDLNGFKAESKPFIPLFEAALLSLEQIAVDPIETEVQRFAGELGIDVKKFYAEHELLKDTAFDAKTKMVHHIWRDSAGRCAQYSVGAPEAVFEICEWNAEQKKEILRSYEKMAAEGYRLVAVAVRDVACESEVALSGLNFVGLLAMSDPPRAGVKEAIAGCREAGIRVIMITGDNKLTAHTVAENIGLDHNERIISGDELETMSPAVFLTTVKNYDIFARVKPEQKYAIVDALQKSGEVVAMTGDGVNDAPALKRASIGLAMGEKGTEVARSASGIVLLDDNFTTIVSAVKEGRRIYENLRQAFVFLFSFHLPIVGLAVLPLFFGQPFIFAPIHIIFLELICDPASVLGFERERARRALMKEPPRRANEPIIDPRLWWRVLVQGLAILAVSFSFYYYFTFYLYDPDTGRTAAFVSLVISQIFLILFTREWIQVISNKLLLFISALTFFVLALLLAIPALREVFSFVLLPGRFYIWIVVAPFLAMSSISLFVSKRR